MPDESLRLLVIGAHPDDAEFHAGGLISIYGDAGHTVKIIPIIGRWASWCKMRRIWSRCRRLSPKSRRCAAD